ncbi:MAG TPA: cytochrome P450 [Sporichthyaceae bacterium]|jgi:hypothetical protein|nr:cytochrome P450 [Sporichthyaceae bacterium]
MSTTADTDASVRWDDTSGAFLVTGFDAASAVLRGHGWSCDLRLSPLVSPGLKDLPQGSLLITDPPEHTRLRRLVSPAFTPTAIASLRPRIAAIADAVLDGLPEIGARVDVVADVGYPVSLAVICELLDVGGEGAQAIAAQTPDLVRAAELRATVEDLMASAVANLELMLFLTPILARRREHPGRDFISALLALSDDHDPDGLSLGEVMGTCLLLLVAGHETTANLIANSTLALLQHPDQIPNWPTRGAASRSCSGCTARCAGPYAPPWWTRIWRAVTSAPGRRFWSISRLPTATRNGSRTRCAWT